MIEGRDLISHSAFVLCTLLKVCNKNISHRNRWSEFKFCLGMVIYVRRENSDNINSFSRDDKTFFVCVQHIDRQGHITRDSCEQWTSLTKFSRFKTENSNVNPSSKIFLVFTSVISQYESSKKWRKMFTVIEASGGGPILVWYYMFLWGGLLKLRTQNLTLSSCSYGASIEFFSVSWTSVFLFFLQSFSFFFERARDRLGFSDIDKNSKWDINDSLFALLLVFSWEVSGLFFCFTFDYNFVLEEAACCPSVSFFVKFLLVFQVSFGFSMVMRFKSLGSYSAFDFLSFFKFFCFRLDFSNRQRCFLVFFKFLILS